MVRSHAETTRSPSNQTHPVSISPVPARSGDVVVVSGRCRVTLLATAEREVQLIGVCHSKRPERHAGTAHAHRTGLS